MLRSSAILIRPLWSGRRIDAEELVEFAMSRATVLSVALLALAATATGAGFVPAPGAEAKPIDFAKVPRTIARQPTCSGTAAYGCFLFGLNGEIPMWAVLDRSSSDGRPPDVLYLDLDVDGDLTDEGERFEATKAARGEIGSELAAPVASFTIGSIEVGGLKHTDFQITVRATRVGWSMRWRGEKVTMGGYAPSHAECADFAPTPAAAPLYVPGYDRPFEFERWIREPLKRGTECDFKVFLGNRGSRLGTFSCVDDKFLPPDEHVVATLICQVEGGKEVRVRNELKERC
jgi:hypothetical protein